MRERWNQLALREKQMVSVAGIAIVLFLIYSLLWEPLTNRVEILRGKILKDQNLLVWMQETDKRISTAQTTSKPASTKNNASILTIVQHQINKTPLVSSLSQLRQAENESVQMSFSNVEFDKLIKWLTQIWQQEGLTVAHIVVTASPTAGLVSAELTIKKAT